MKCGVFQVTRCPNFMKNVGLLLLRDVEGWSVKEAAEVLGASKANTKVGTA
jgi:hypothetical protein